MDISVVITTFNRAGLVSRSIESVINCFSSTRADYEIILVDDFSTDNTVESIRHRFSNEIGGNLLSVVTNIQNRGVTYSKNAGYRIAKGKWVIFLDSDDEMIAGAGPAVFAACNKYTKNPIIFFRCIDESGNTVGEIFPNDRLIDLKLYLHKTSFGEALTAVNKVQIGHDPYIAELRGYEGLGCTRMIHEKGDAVLSVVMARRYYRSGNDRLSSSAGFIKRMPLLAKGNFLMLHEFGTDMGLKLRMDYFVKAVIYALTGAVAKLFFKK